MRRSFGEFPKGIFDKRDIDLLKADLGKVFQSPTVAVFWE